VPFYRVRVVASYRRPEESPSPDTPDAMTHADAVVEAIRDWAGEIEHRRDNVLGVEIAEDHQLIPPRLTMTVVYEVEAPSERDAQEDVLSAFRDQSETLPLPESLAASITQEDVEGGWERPH